MGEGDSSSSGRGSHATQIHGEGRRPPPQTLDRAARTWLGRLANKTCRSVDNDE